MSTETIDPEVVQPEVMPWSGYREEGYRSNYSISDEYKIARLMRMLAGYDDATWDRLKPGRQRSYMRAASSLFHQWADFELAMDDFREGDLRCKQAIRGREPLNQK